jgi:hypothetical protein
MRRRLLTMLSVVALAVAGLGIASPASAGMVSGCGNCASTSPGKMVTAQGTMRANGSMVLTAPSVSSVEMRNLRTGDRVALRGKSAMGTWSVSSATTPTGSYACV